MISNALLAGRRSALLVLTLALAMLAGAAAASEADLDRRFPRSTLQIATPDARLHTFRVWVADSDARRIRGLMYVKELAEDAGMLFLYDEPQRISMWMKNTFIPLDMVFVRSDGRVDSVAENTRPHSLDSIPSQGEVVAVIELNAGTAARLGIRPGARVLHPAFQTR
ncbi:MAG: DUF192 domain-containing protein [Proteobacteria bacterium]|nr:MAG: DUF192 domain-containing protein [Pseudomonadota bacterium]